MKIADHFVLVIPPAKVKPLRLVYWKLLSQPWFKLNVDGCVRDRDRKYGGVVFSKIIRGASWCGCLQNDWIQ